MKFLKLVFLFGFLCKGITADQNNQTEKNVSFSVLKIWSSYRTKDCTCQKEDEPWKEDVQEYYDGCSTAIKTFRGKAYDLADTVVTSLEEYLSKMIYFTSSNSSIVTSSSLAILNSLSRCKNLGQSSEHIISEFEKVFPDIVEDFNDVATKLSDQIGKLTCSFTEAVSDLGSVFSRYMKEFLLNSQLVRCKRVNFEDVLKKLQKLLNTAALISETLLNECEGKATQDVHEAVMILDLMCLYMSIVVQGINSCVLDVNYDRNCFVPASFKSCSLSFDYALIEATRAVSEVVFPFQQNIKELLAIFVNITMALNTALKNVLGLFDGVAITVGEISKNLLNGLTIKRSVTQSRTNILKGVVPN